MAVLIERRTIAGPPVVVGNVRATPRARVFIARLPFGAFVWNRPTSVEIERNGLVEHQSIVDVTRIAQTTLWACALAALLAYRRWPKLSRGKEH